MTLLYTAPYGQLLGTDADSSGRVVVANAGDVFGADADGEVLELTDVSVEPLFTGPPLVTPSGVAIVWGSK